MKDTIVVTGGTKGIGKAIIKLFADKGFDIITCARSSADLELLHDELKISKPDVSVQSLSCDLSIREDVNSFISFTQSHVATLKILVNNAGTFIPGQIHNEAEGVFERTIATNLTSAYHLTRGLLTNLIANKGHLFNICSTASIMPYSNGGSYCISKYALLGLTKVLREELKSKQVKVTAILPGPTFTTSWEGYGLPEERFIKPEDVAHALWGAYALSPGSVVEEILIRPQEGDID